MSFSFVKAHRVIHKRRILDAEKGVDSKGTKRKQPSKQAHDTYQMRLKTPNDMGYKKALCYSRENSILYNLDVV